MSRLYHPQGGDVPQPAVSGQVRSAASIVAIIAALASFYFSHRGTESLGFILAFVAMAAGLIGGVKALSPRVSGGILSIAAVVMGAIALVYAFICLLV
jgi:hypothetical protein